jgi:anti-anti-sigma factor
MKDVRRQTPGPTAVATGLRTRQFADRTEVQGEVDLFTAEEFTAAVEEACMRGCLLDLGEVSFMDSNGLRILLGAAARRDGAPLIMRPSAAVRRLFEVAAPMGVPGLQFGD